MKNDLIKSNLSSKKQFKFLTFATGWEMILAYIFILINIVLMALRPSLYFSFGTFPAIIRSGMDLSIMVLGMVMILLIGEIDVSVGSIMLLSCTVMGEVFSLSGSWVLTVVCGILAGGLCGLINGLLVSKIKIPSVIVTIATALVFKGAVEVILKDQVLTEFPAWYFTLAWEDIGGFLPLSFICFIAIAVIFGIVVHKTKFGRKLYIIGANKKVALYSGIRVDFTVIVVYVIMGVTAALSGILFVGRLSGISPSMGQGYELRVIAIAVFGGVSTKGGKGKVIGAVISTLVMAFLCKTLDLLSVQVNVQKIIIGAILIVAVIIPFFKENNKKRLVTDSVSHDKVEEKK